VSGDYIRKLTAAYPCVTEVWLFGSRANGEERPASDWDYVVFADDDRLMNWLCHDKDFNVPNVDLLVVAAPSVAMRPWPDETGWHKKLGLGPEDMDWRNLSSKAVQYRASKQGPAGRVVLCERKAILVYRR
jgi:predicted nucleotidyltransferase